MRPLTGQQQGQTVAEIAPRIVELAPRLGDHYAISVRRLIYGLPALPGHPTGPALRSVTGLGDMAYEDVRLTHLEYQRDRIREHVGAKQVRRAYDSGRTLLS